MPLSFRTVVRPLSGLLLALAASSTLASDVPALRVVASFSIIGDMARAVGGERIALTTLVGPNGDAHVYAPRPADAVAVAHADVVLANGLGFEGFIARLVSASGGSAQLTELTTGIDALPMKRSGHDDGPAKAEKRRPGAHDHGHEHDHGHGARDSAAAHDHGPIDPHAWHSLRNARIYVDNIARAFCRADADGCPVYQANATAYRDKLSVLASDLRALLADIPPSRRIIVSPHDAFGYLARDFDLTIHAPQGVSTESEASAADVARLIRTVQRSGAAALFVENVSNPRLIEQISRETGITVGGALYSDALSGPDGPAPTYVDLMRHNVTAIAEAIRAGIR